METLPTLHIMAKYMKFQVVFYGKMENIKLLIAGEDLSELERFPVVGILKSQLKLFFCRSLFAEARSISSFTNLIKSSLSPRSVSTPPTEGF